MEVIHAKSRTVPRDLTLYRLWKSGIDTPYLALRYGLTQRYVYEVINKVILASQTEFCCVPIQNTNADSMNLAPERGSETADTTQATGTQQFTLGVPAARVLEVPTTAT